MSSIWALSWILVGNGTSRSRSYVLRQISGGGDGWPLLTWATPPHLFPAFSALLATPPTPSSCSSVWITGCTLLPDMRRTSANYIHSCLRQKIRGSLFHLRFLTTRSRQNSRGCLTEAGIFSESPFSWSLMGGWWFGVVCLLAWLAFLCSFSCGSGPFIFLEVLGFSFVSSFLWFKWAITVD